MEIKVLVSDNLDDIEGTKRMKEINGIMRDEQREAERKCECNLRSGVKGKRWKER